MLTDDGSGDPALARGLPEKSIALLVERTKPGGAVFVNVRPVVVVVIVGAAFALGEPGCSRVSEHDAKYGMACAKE